LFLLEREKLTGRAARSFGVNSSKLRPPPLPAGFFPRVDIGRRLDAALARRVTSAVAGPGFGKSTVTAAWAIERSAAWYTVDPADRSWAIFLRGLCAGLATRVPDASAGLVAVGVERVGSGALDSRRAETLAASVLSVLDPHLDHDIAIVLDDVHLLAEQPASLRLLESIIRNAPHSLHLVCCSREAPRLQLDRLQAHGEIALIGPRDLAFSKEDVEIQLRQALDRPTSEVASKLYGITGGWPVAVRLGIEWLRSAVPSEHADMLDRLGSADGPMFGYLAGEVFAREPAAVRQLLRVVAPLEQFSIELCQSLGLAQVRDSVESLLERGLAQGELAGELRLHALARDFAGAHWPLTPERRSAIHRQAALIAHAQGDAEFALDEFVAAGDWALVRRQLQEHGTAIVVTGGAETVVRAAEALPGGERDPFLAELVGHAYLALGDHERAGQQLATAAEQADELPAGLAWKLGVIEYQGGSTKRALEILTRGRIESGDTVDEALLLAFTANAYYRVGDALRCQELASSALAAARASDSERAVAHALHAQAMQLCLDRQFEAAGDLFRRQLVAAEAAGDLHQLSRGHCGLAEVLARIGELDVATTAAEIGLETAERSGFTTFVPNALCVRGALRFRQGLLDEAISDLEEARSLMSKKGWPAVAAALSVLGDVYRERGRLALAGGLYEQALTQARASGSAVDLQRTLGGLSRLLVLDDPVQAAAFADEAAEFAKIAGEVDGLVAAGWTLLACGDRGAAASQARAAVALAKASSDRLGLISTLELAGFVALERERCLEQLDEAHALARELGDRLTEARVELALATLRERPAAERERARRKLVTLGVHEAAARSAGALMELGTHHAPTIVVQTFGGFRVVRAGEPVALTEWKSKKARDLLKILITRRGRPIPRDALMEALWPGGDPTAVANRLSVALSTIRRILTPDRPHERSAVVVVGDAITLNLSRVLVDLETFFSDAETGLALLQRGGRDDALEILRSAEEAYVGDFLEEDLYEDWAAAMREEARLVYLAVARALAEAASAKGQYETASRYRLRCLERDPHDERAHHGLISSFVGAGRIAEARRAYATYVVRMEEIGVEPATFATAASAI
jgi:ATP/maltotriose-dependent transcriptional regulator MalT/DNA-binding SARP family transcriptional activator